MKTYLEFINEEYNDTILNIDDLAELVSRLQEGPEMKKIMKVVMLKHYRDLLDRKGNYAVKREFEENTDLKIKTIARGKYKIIYDTEKTMQYK